MLSLREKRTLKALTQTVLFSWCVIRVCGGESVLVFVLVFMDVCVCVWDCVDVCVFVFVCVCVFV